jgi:geranylgeranyl diphosphate synthase type II
MVAGQVNRDAEIAAAAVEMIHTYSLIHDDLPAMDDDDMRRGRPSCHRQFDEATAILAGDGLLTLAFEILATEVKNPATAVAMIRTLSKAAGPAGMIAGQMADMEGSQAVASMESLEYIHTNKTAEMFAASAVLGGIAGQATDSQIDALRRYGMKIGLGFQIADDLLDVTSSAENLGKTAGKDMAQGKLTYPALVGIDQSRQLLEKVTSEAISALSGFRPAAAILQQLAEQLLTRTK